MPSHSDKQKRLAAALQYAQQVGKSISDFGSGVSQNLANRARDFGGIAYEAMTSDPNMYRMTTSEYGQAANRSTPRLDQMAQDVGTIGKAIVTQPIETGKALVRGEIQRARNAMDNPRAAGEYAGSFIDPLRIASALRRIPKVAEIAEYDPRFDARVKERERLQALTPVVESRKTVNAPEVSITQFEGRPFITSMSDRTAAGGLLRGINDVKFSRPVNLQGGQDFMFENPGMVWASGVSPTKKIMKMAKEVKAITGQDPLYIPWRMAPTGGDFASMTGETMLNYADAALTKNVKKEVDQAIRAFIPDWAGVGTERGLDQFRNAKDSVRKAIKNKLDTEFREKGGLSIGEARLSVTDPRQYSAPDAGVQNIGLINTDRPIIQQSGHAAYPAGVPGEGIGRIKEDVRIFELLNEAAKSRGIVDPRAPRATDIRALQMKPYHGLITAEALKKMGY